MKSIMTKIAVVVLMMGAAKSFARSACQQISGTYPKCQVQSALDPSVSINYENVKLTATSGDNFKIEMLMDGESKSADVVADGIERDGQRALCSNGTLRFFVSEEFEDSVIESTHAFSVKDGKLTIEMSIFGDVWQTTVCQ